MSMIDPVAGTEATNADFRSRRTANNKGGDVRVLSDVRRITSAAPDSFDVRYDRSGRLLQETRVDMVQVVDGVDWQDRRAVIKLVADWPLPD
jgi:hypothetical protein